MWPDLTVAEAAPRLHKVAHYARRALGEDRTAIVLRSETVALLPDAEVVVDVDVFERVAEQALANGTPSAAAAAAARYGGTLLPEDLYEPWAENRREHLRLRYLELLRLAGRWEDLLVEDPADEEAHRRADDAARRARRSSCRAAAVRADGRGATPRAGRRLRVSARWPSATRFWPPIARVPRRSRPSQPGRPQRANWSSLERLLADAAAARGRTVLVSGPPGVGKSALLDWVSRRAERVGWRVGHGVAAAVEGAWPYAPVLEALADLCRRHPTLLDGLADTYRAGDRTASGRAPS